jgi:hypothetical protein
MRGGGGCGDEKLINSETNAADEQSISWAIKILYGCAKLIKITCAILCK